MRLIDALVASAAIHAGMLALPTGDLSFSSTLTPSPPSEPLRAELRPRQAKSGVSVALSSRESPSEASATRPEAEANENARPEGLGLGVPMPYYYSPIEVSARASPAQEIDLEPPELRAIPGQGKLILVLWINEAGTVDRIEVESSQVAGAMETILAEQFRRASFAPAQLDGKPVKSRMRIEVVVRPPAAYVVPPPPPRPKPASAAEN
jgi:outer membrane biosynthesis protein TonB